MIIIIIEILKCSTLLLHLKSYIISFYTAENEVISYSILNMELTFADLIAVKSIDSEGNVYLTGREHYFECHQVLDKSGLVKLYGGLDTERAVRQF